ncbi:hypothetical protein FRC11_005444 [Ceratobasidium sp. 423]|nr:hypothetical protein FRC11_005444 [Ceratobasidium sp. 423]
MTTSSWVMEKLESLSATCSSITPSQSASNAPPGNSASRRGRAETPAHMLQYDEDETRLKDGDYDVDEGSVPESSDSEEHHKQDKKKSIYIDDEAMRGDRTKTRKTETSSSTNSGSDEEPPTKRRKSKASPAKQGGRKKRASGDESDEQPSKGLERWTGTSQGVIDFSPKPHNLDTNSVPLWTYSADGIARQSPNHRAIGDIHFAPNLGAGPPFHYWVQVGTTEGGCWELYNPGRQHPLYAGYVLTGRKGKYAPCWALKDD